MISFLGVVGTIIGFIIFSLLFTLINNFIFHTLSLKEIMLLSSVLCATDTVAAMSLIKPDKYPVLNAVLFGEGIINDAVAIILFRTVIQLQLDDTGGFTAHTVLMMVIDFIVLFVFSLAIGAATGFGLSYLLKVNESFNRSPIKETSLILLIGYMTYLLGELLGLSGIITLFTCSIIMGHYTFMNISEESQRATGLAFETVSYIAEAFVYAYLGASILSLSGEWLAVAFAVFALLFLPFIRAIMVYTLPLIYRCLNRGFPLNDKELKICWYSGLVRGVIAFALCLQIETEDKKYLTTIVVVVVMFTTLVGASMLKSFAECIGLTESEIDVLQENKSTSLLQESSYKTIDFGLDSEMEKDKLEDEGVKNKFEAFETEYMVPLFKRRKPSFNLEIEVTEMNTKKLTDPPTNKP